jgi:hypothetical protein
MLSQSSSHSFYIFILSHAVAEAQVIVYKLQKFYQRCLFYGRKFTFIVTKVKTLTLTSNKEILYYFYPYLK